MALLRFFHGTMGSGKSTQALQIHHNLSRRGQIGLLFTQLDRAGGVVSSRLGVHADAIQVRPQMDLEQFVLDDMAVNNRRIDFLVCDESQFYEPTQIDQLARLVDVHGIDIWAFGLLTSFQGVLFPGTARLLELADERQEMQVEARCWCGARATHNARLVDGVQVYEGDLKVLGDTATTLPATEVQERLELAGPEVTYELLCRRHWIAGQAVAPDHAVRTAADPAAHDPAAHERPEGDR
ncbi:MAG: thymidine kinase [Microthrixaceae bacterium]